jgi:hypothetical protein
VDRIVRSNCKCSSFLAVREAMNEFMLNDEIDLLVCLLLTGFKGATGARACETRAGACATRAGACAEVNGPASEASSCAASSLAEMVEVSQLNRRKCRS